MRKLFFFFLCLPLFVFAQRNYDVILRNGKIIDGTGNSWYYSDMAISSGKIIAIQKHINDTAATIIHGQRGQLAST